LVLFSQEKVMKKHKCGNLWLVLAGFTLVGTLSSTPVIATNNNNPGIAPMQSKPHGHSYSEWQTIWWQWALEQPASVNPVTDSNGEFCSTGQKGAVWFLAGTFGDPPSVKRTCTVPTGQAFFFPVIDFAYFAFLNDPPETRTPAFIRSQVDCEVLSATVEIDGVRVTDAKQYFLGSEKSLLFDVQLPEDNVFGATLDTIPELLLSPSATSGLFLFLSPLPPGKHTLHWEASESCLLYGDFAQNITYELTVKPHGDHADSHDGHSRHIP
jgi:hypothetical protein